MNVPRDLLGAIPETGQGLVEYGLILALVAIICIGSLLFFGNELSSILSLISSAV